MNAPAHRLDILGTVITGWPATAIILAVIFLLLFALSFVFGWGQS